jgi:hypothetical protein
MIASKTACWLTKLLVFMLTAATALAEGAVEVLRTKTDTYQNVTLVSRTKTHVFVNHSRGMATLKIADLSDEALIGLGLLDAPVVAETAVRPDAPTDLATAMAPIEEIAHSLPASMNGKGLAELKLPANLKVILLICLGVMVLFHLFFSYCAMLICKKAGTEPGIMVWLPVLQVYSLIRAAGMSGWWFLACFVPLLNIVAQVLWSINIAKARGKGVLTTIMLLLPVTNVFAFLYLAFSAGSSEEDAEDDAKPIRLSPLPV